MLVLLVPESQQLSPLLPQQLAPLLGPQQPPLCLQQLPPLLPPAPVLPQQLVALQDLEALGASQP